MNDPLHTAHWSQKWQLAPFCNQRRYVRSVCILYPNVECHLNRGMRRKTTFRSTTHRIYDVGPQIIYM